MRTAMIAVSLLLLAAGSVECSAQVLETRRAGVSWPNRIDRLQDSRTPRRPVERSDDCPRLGRAVGAATGFSIGIVAGGALGKAMSADNLMAELMQIGTGALVGGVIGRILGEQIGSAVDCDRVRGRPMAAQCGCAPLPPRLPPP